MLLLFLAQKSNNEIGAVSTPGALSGPCAIHCWSINLALCFACTLPFACIRTKKLQGTGRLCLPRPLPFFFSPSYLVDPLRPSVLLLCLKSCDQLAPRRPVLKPGLSMSYWVPNQQKKILAVRLLANWIGRWLPPPQLRERPCSASQHDARTAKGTDVCHTRACCGSSTFVVSVHWFVLLAVFT